MSGMQMINFHGNEITVIEKDGIQYVAMKPIVEAMGLDWSRQFRKITNDPVLNSTVAEMAMVAEDGRERKMICLPLDFLNGWLFKIDANRYKNDFDRFNTIVTYQQKCYRVLFDYFHKGGAINPAMLRKLAAELLAESEQRIAVLAASNANLRNENRFLRSFAPNGEPGEISRETGNPKYRFRRGYYTSDLKARPVKLLFRQPDLPGLTVEEAYLIEEPEREEAEVRA